jgi:hypothetical protein
MGFSSYGWRFNLQGWGENVITTGYGDLYQEGSTPDLDYTSVFAGTSSASAHVAAAVACYSAFATPTFGAADAFTLRSRFVATGTPQSFGRSGNIGPRPDLMRLYVWSAPPPLSDGGDYGDAPEGAIAYPASAVVGRFPTVLAPTTPVPYMMHARQPSPLLHLGDGLDYEYDGNAGIPFLDFIAYDADECYDPAPSDDGLLFPAAFTIQGSSVVPCTSGPANLGAPCTQAVWGVDIDVEVVNQLASDAWLNVLIDWNQDGEWGGSSTCGSRVPELAVENVPIPPTGPNPVPLSTLVLGLQPILIGPLDGYVWARFTLTDAPLNNPTAWEGGLSEPSGAGWGVAVIGETEDYLLEIGSGSVAVSDGAPEASSIHASVFPNPLRSKTVVSFHLRDATDVSVDLFDVQGRLARRLGTGLLPAGQNQVTWDGLGKTGSPVPAGMYLCRISGKGVNETMKLFVER